MIGIDVALLACGFAAVLSSYRIVVGPTPADRAVASDLLTFALVALVGLIGLRAESTATLDLVLVATLVAFLSSVSLARALTRGWR